MKTRSHAEAPLRLTDSPTSDWSSPGIATHAVRPMPTATSSVRSGNALPSGTVRPAGSHRATQLRSESRGVGIVSVDVRARSGVWGDVGVFAHAAITAEASSRLAG